MEPTRTTLRVAIVGAGREAAELLDGLARRREIAVTALVDAQLRAARRRADRHRVAVVHRGIDELLAAGGFDAAAVVAAGPARMAAVARLVNAGIPVVAAMPADVDVARFEAVVHAARERGVPLRFVDRGLAAAELANLSPLLHAPLHVTAIHRTRAPNVATPDLDDPAFASEAAVFAALGQDALSTAIGVVGHLDHVTASASAPIVLVDGRPFRPIWLLHGHGRAGSLVARFEFGAAVDESFLDVGLPHGTLRIDLAGVGLADAMMPFFVALQTEPAAGLARRSAADGIERARAVLTTTRAMLAESNVSDAAFVPDVPPPAGAARHGEVVVVGARHPLAAAVVRSLLDAGRPVTVVDPRPERLAAPLRDVRLRRVVADPRRADELTAAIDGAAYAVLIADGVPTDDVDERLEDLVLAAEAIGRACLAHRVRRLVAITDLRVADLAATRAARDSGPIDPAPWFRPMREQGLVLVERTLRRMLVERTLRVTFLRPGIVVGADQPAFRADVGRVSPRGDWVTYGATATGLPFVLARDVGTAVNAALDAGAAVGRTFDLVGDVRPTAAEYAWRLGEARHRPIRYRPRPVFAWYLTALARFLVRFPTRDPAPLPSWRELRGRSFPAAIDTSVTKSVLRWRPQDDADAFWREVAGAS